MSWDTRNTSKLRLAKGVSLNQFCEHLRDWHNVKNLYGDLSDNSIDRWEFSENAFSVFNEGMGLGVDSGVLDEAFYFDTSRGMCIKLEKCRGFLSHIQIKKDSEAKRDYAVHAVLYDDIEACIEAGWLEIYEPQPVNQPKQEKSKMNNLKNSLVNTGAANKTAAGQAVALTVGKAGNKLVTGMIKPKLPLGTRSLADGFIGSLIAANMTAFAVNQFMPDNKKAVVVSQAMLTAAMVQALDEFDIEGMLSDVMDKIKGGKVDQLLDSEDLDLDLK